MGTKNIAVVVGSIRRDSYNLKLAMAVSRLMPAGFNPNIVKIDDLPIYNEDRDDNPPAEVTRLKVEISAADGLLFVCPEHNRTLTAALKNAIDWVSRPYGKNLWAGKPAGVLGASVSGLGSALAQQHLRNVLAYLDVPTLGQPEIYIHFKQGMIDQDGNVTHEPTLQLLASFIGRYSSWIDHLTSKSPLL